MLRRRFKGGQGFAFRPQLFFRCLLVAKRRDRKERYGEKQLLDSDQEHRNEDRKGKRKQRKQQLPTSSILLRRRRVLILILILILLFPQLRGTNTGSSTSSSRSELEHNLPRLSIGDGRRSRRRSSGSDSTGNGAGSHYTASSSWGRIGSWKSRSSDVRSPEDREVLLEDVGVLVDPGSCLVEDLMKGDGRQHERQKEASRESDRRLGLTRALVKMSCYREEKKTASVTEEEGGAERGRLTKSE